MKPSPKTAAEQQIELLRQLKEAKARRKPAPLPAAPKAAAPPPPQAARTGPAAGPAAGPAGAHGLELVEAESPSSKAKAAGPSLPVSRETWRRLRDRQRVSREFRRRKDMGEWAAALLLALPAGAHELGPEARAELFRRMQEYCASRGLK